MSISRHGPHFRLDSSAYSNLGQSCLRGILIRAMHEDASRVTLQPHESHSSLVHTIMWFIREKPINTLGPGWDELLDYLRTLPNSNLRLNLDNLVDEYVLEHVPVNDLAHEQIVAYRASPRKDYEVIIHINEEENEVEILLSLIKVKR